MIFIPKENVNTKESETFYFHHWNRPDGNSILLMQSKENPLDVFIESVNYRYYVLPCSEIACQCNPQLRYNSIAGKFFMVCPSSLICTEDNDQAELEFIKENSCELFDDALDAIIEWNISEAMTHIEIAKKRFKQDAECPPGMNCDLLDSTPNCKECWENYERNKNEQ